MSKPLIISNTITINAPAAKVWDALVNPEQTKKYMFTCEAISDWKVGSPLLWKMVHDGKALVAVKGTVAEIRPQQFLAYTTIDPNAGLADVPENYLTVTYSLSAQNDQTELTVTQGDYARVGDGEKRYKDTEEGGGWMPILVEIKRLVES